MATNNFKAFALDPNANVMSQAEWEALPALLSGFTAGKASSEQVNKAIRQSSSMAAALAQFCLDATGDDVLDNGDISALAEQILNSVSSLTPGRLLNVRAYAVSSIYTPTPGTKKIRVKVWGAGGGGGNSSVVGIGGFSGGGGGYAESYIDASSISTVTVTVGSGGAAVAGGTASAATTGGTSSFGSYLSSSGGSSSGGVAAGGAVINSNGQGGQGPNGSVGGVGGAAYSAYGGLPHSTYAGDNGGYPGGGGAGGSYANASAAYASGKGANGFVLVEEYS
ncbi:glycine-rich domain-containing protein [Escherichia coli]|uniref:glycine-rich domain-containing protein n=1 Tax=Escherichia coli TaxID=562 RepID=UPI002FEEFFD4